MGQNRYVLRRQVEVPAERIPVGRLILLQGLVVACFGTMLALQAAGPTSRTNRSREIPDTAPRIHARAVAAPAAPQMRAIPPCFVEQVAANGTVELTARVCTRPPATIRFVAGPDLPADF